jgi:thiamine pyrophosphate-dependent acetolactate synthase large subunit-like protein
MKMKGAEAIVKSLEKAPLSIVFGNCERGRQMKHLAFRP